MKESSIEEVVHNIIEMQMNITMNDELKRFSNVCYSGMAFNDFMELPYRIYRKYVEYREQVLKQIIPKDDDAKKAGIK